MNDEQASLGDDQASMDDDDVPSEDNLESYVDESSEDAGQGSAEGGPEKRDMSPGEWNRKSAEALRKYAEQDASLANLWLELGSGVWKVHGAECRSMARACASTSQREAALSNALEQVPIDSKAEFAARLCEVIALEAAHSKRLAEKTRASLAYGSGRWPRWDKVPTLVRVNLEALVAASRSLAQVKEDPGSPDPAKRFESVWAAADSSVREAHSMWVAINRSMVGGK